MLYEIIKIIILFLPLYSILDTEKFVMVLIFNKKEL